MQWLAQLFSRGRRYDDLSTSIHEHLEQRTDELMEEGWRGRRLSAPRAGDRSVIGRNIEIDSQPREIVGVMPRGFRLVNQDFDVLAPLAFDRNQLKLAGFGYNGVARLKQEASIAQANADKTRMLPVWMDSFSNGPDTNPHFYETWRITPAIRPLKQQVLGNVGNVLWVVMATIGLVDCNS